MKIQSIFFLLFMIFFNHLASAQCSPKVYNKDHHLSDSATYCENEPIQFNENSHGFNDISTDWNFGDGTSSTAANPQKSYTAAGTYTVNFTGVGTAGTCNKDLTITIEPSPVIDFKIVNPDTQCFENNQFCFEDNTVAAPGSQIVRQTYEFSDGHRIDKFKPSFPINFCYSVVDPRGGFFDVIIESEDTNGCVSKITFADYFYVTPKLGIEFLNVTPPPNPGCDSVLGKFQNISGIGLSDVASFTWNWGDGTMITGDSVTNTEWWDGSAMDGIVQHMYRENGTFDGSLTVTSDFGCTETFTWKAAVTNIILKPVIFSDKDSSYAVDKPVNFWLKDGPPSGASRWLWNFGDPSSGPLNFNDQEWEVSHRYGTGPWMIWLNVIVGPCNVTVYDTIIINGPRAIIETVGDSIPWAEKYQCRSKDTVHFTNNSKFYHNDDNIYDEDSFVLVDGKPVLAFDPFTWTSLSSPNHLANRTMGEQVHRLWDFGDEYAETCTTDMAKGINIAKNCNFSRDEFPVHLYPNWEDVYIRDYYNTNQSFVYNSFDHENDQCVQQLVDTSESALHRTLFYKLIPHDFKAVLYLKDTLSGAESVDSVYINHSPPDASGLKLISGAPCGIGSGIGSSDPYLVFDINGRLSSASTPYFAVNFDSFADPENFIPLKSGAVLEPISDSLIYIPLVIPRKFSGKFIKRYDLKELNNYHQRKPKGSFTIGLITGNGAIDSNGLPECADTAWYHDMFRMPYLNANFQVLTNKIKNEQICAGETVYFKMDDELSTDISTLRWNWGYNGFGNKYSFDFYYEEFYHLQDYTGPSSTRNDKDIVYTGEDWKYSYLIRKGHNNVFGHTIIDTIVMAIHKNWKTETNFEGDIKSLTHAEANTYYSDIDEKILHKFLGDGSSACIDTSGISEKFSFKYSGYRNDDPLIVRHGNKRYKYSDAAKTDSIEVAHILHFRDSSLQGYDTFIRGKDTITGVWKYEYKHFEITETCGVKDTILRNSTGPMLPYLSLYNQSGCNAYGVKLLNVGIYSEFKFEEQALCSGNTVKLRDSIRYWQYGDESWPNHYPINPVNYWNDPDRYLPGYEYFEIDWDSTDGLDDFKQPLSLEHQYDEPGNYVITVHVKDSMHCHDTIYIDTYINSIEADFYYDSAFTDCEAVYSFHPDIRIFDHCSDSSNCNSDACDSVISYNWWLDEGDSPLANPSTSYTTGGERRVRLEVQSAKGCKDSISRLIHVPGRDPQFEFHPDHTVVNDTLYIEEGDSVIIHNLSEMLAGDTFKVSWGDASFENCNEENCSHIYSKLGIYKIYITQYMTAAGTTEPCAYIYPPLNGDKQFVVVVRKKGGIEKFDQRPAVSIYPNPNSGSFTISAKEKIEDFSIFDIHGKVLDAEEKWTNPLKVELQMDNISPGVYYINIETVSGKAVKKILVW